MDGSPDSYLHWLHCLPFMDGNVMSDNQNVRVEFVDANGTFQSVAIKPKVWEHIVRAAHWVLRERDSAKTDHRGQPIAPRSEEEQEANRIIGSLRNF